MINRYDVIFHLEDNSLFYYRAFET